MSETSKLYRKIADSVADAIERGDYKVGDRLPTERDLAERYSVSRPSVREAMIALEVLGMIETVHGQGNFVAAASRPVVLGNVDTEVGAFELIEARLLFEGEAAALAATAIDEEQIDQLEALLKRMVMNDEDGEDADREFHLLITRASANGVIIATIENLWSWRDRSPLTRTMLLRARGLGTESRMADHRRLVDALKAQDPAGARQAMRDHLERVMEFLVQVSEREAVQRVRQETSARRLAIAKRFSA